MSVLLKKSLKLRLTLVITVLADRLAYMGSTGGLSIDYERYNTKFEPSAILDVKFGENDQHFSHQNKHQCNWIFFYINRNLFTHWN